MSSPGEEGGTRIQKRQQPPPQPQFNQAPPQMQQPPPEQMYQQQQQQQQQPPQMYQPLPQPPPPPNIVKFGKTSRFSAPNLDSVTFKYSILVACIFVLLNSKIIWTQIIKLPLMGNVEPSILALIVNSMLAAVIFYIISKQF